MNKLPDFEMYWDQELDGRLIYRALAFNSEPEHAPLFSMTVEFSPAARRHFSDDGCRRMIEEMASERIQRSFSTIERPGK